MNGLRKGKILVVGSTNTDMVVRTERLPRPGETVLGGTFLMNPGGKGANQAVAAARLGADVIFVCKKMCIRDSSPAVELPTRPDARSRFPRGGDPA